jgi:hypothetical protein
MTPGGSAAATMLRDDQFNATVAEFRAADPELVRSLLYEVAVRVISRLSFAAADLRRHPAELVEIGAALLATADLLGIDADDAEAILAGAINEKVYPSSHLF